jgi:hypothetical protein
MKFLNFQKSKTTEIIGAHVSNELSDKILCIQSKASNSICAILFVKKRAKLNSQNKLFSQNLVKKSRLIFHCTFNQLIDFTFSGQLLSKQNLAKVKNE